MLEQVKLNCFTTSIVMEQRNCIAMVLRSFRDTLFTPTITQCSPKMIGRGYVRCAITVKKRILVKVDRFGLGFKSVFHVTDLLSIVSGSTVYVGMIDPPEKYFSDGTNRQPGYSWRMKDRNLVISIPDQFSP
ncbi:PREDICTED: sacsin-like isoform X2 [Acropora digitifera]|uniref:sacsin-like isoform X2 n=1 Tax=Acropora digitifera TaxID=70779 RepID=UPI00077AB082|nr:PREDICTED: sacsin-like isoform X2 [Acropora digitifera]